MMKREGEGAPLTDALRVLEQTPLSELGPVLDVLAKKVNDHREQNHGFVPREIFAQVLSLAGQYTCIEYLPRVIDDNHEVKGYLLKLRGGEEQAWQGEYQIPGVAVVIEPTRDLMKLADARLKTELNIPGIDLENLTLLPSGVEAHFEKERNTTCLTLVMTVDLNDSILRELEQSSEWKFFQLSEIGSNQIIDHHRNTLKWQSDPGRQDFEFVDLRELL